MKNNIKNIKKYFTVLKNIFDKVEVADDSGKKLQFEKAVEKSIQLIINQSSNGCKLLFIGNGASASISSHVATDFWKNCGIKALSFNDSSLLTCISNDFGFQHVFEKPIEMFANPGDILIPISSSGESENIIRATKIAQEKGLKIITLSGFSKSNRLRKLGDINFYVPREEYGFVEIVHTAICHCFIDMIIKNKTLQTK